MATQLDEMMTAAQLAVALGITPAAIRQRVSRGTLTPVATVGGVHLFAAVPPIQQISDGSER